MENLYRKTRLMNLHQSPRTNQAEKERLIKEGKIKRSKKSAKTSDTPHYENVPFEIPNNWVWTTLGEISNYGDSNNVSVTDIADDEWILELEDLEKDTASIIQILSKKERSIKGVRHKFKKGDVLYSKLRTYLNKVLVAPQLGIAQLKLFHLIHIVAFQHITCAMCCALHIFLIIHSNVVMV